MESTKYNKFQKVINFFLKYGLIIVSAITLIISISSIFITAYFADSVEEPVEKTSFKYSNGLIEILITIVFIFVFWVIGGKIFKKIPSIFIIFPLCLLCFIPFIYWINLVKINPESDQGFICVIAENLLNNNVVFTGPGDYLFKYPYQFGIAYFVYNIYKIFGKEYMYIEYINAGCSIINMILIYFISKRIFKKESVQKFLVILLGGFSLYWLFFNVHYYGNIIGLTFGLLATYFTILYLQKRKIRYILLAGIVISISIILKSNYNIFLCGIVLVLLLDIIKEWKLKPLIIIPLFLLSYMGVKYYYSYSLEKNFDLVLPKGLPMISFVYMGMAEPKNLSPGWYTADTVDIYERNNFDYEKSSKESIKLIKERLTYFKNNPKEFANFYYQKLASTWLNPTFQTVWCSLPGVRISWHQEYADYIIHHNKAKDMLDGNMYNVEENYFNIFEIIVFAFASIGIFNIAKNLDLSQSLLPIIFIGGFLFHLIWETKAIYVIQYYFILLPFTAYGLDEFFENILPKSKNIIQKLKRRKKLEEKFETNTEQNA